MGFLRSFCKALILKKFFLTLNVAVVWLLWSVTSIAAVSGEAANELMQLLGGIKTMQADFVQTALGKGGAQVGQSTTGTMALQRPGKFRWEAKQPTHQLIVANGNRVWLYDVDLEQVTRQSLHTNEQGNPAQLLSGDNAALGNTFNVTRVELDNDSDENCFALQPKNKNNLYRKVQLCFKENKLRSMVMEDNLGQKSSFVFNKIVINANLSSALFVFVPPKNVDVIDNE